jgi:lysophospholipase L1-like esterase
MPLSHRQKVVLSTLLVLLVVVLMLTLAEGTVRVRQWVKYGHFSHLDDIYAMDQETGLRVPRSGASTGTIHINSLGFRGPPVSQLKTAGQLRLAFLGASTTFCAEVSSDELTWPHLVSETINNNASGVTVDYVNGAVPGYTVQSSLMNLRERITPLEPDVIIIYHATNDLSRETRSLAEKQGIYRAGTADEMSWLAEHSLLWFLVEKNLRLRSLREKTTDMKQRLEFSPSQLGSQFEADLKELVTEAKKVSSMVALVTFSHRIRAGQTPEQQLEAAGSALYYMPFMSPPALIDSFARYNEIITEVARETGVLLIDGEELIPGDGEHFNDTVHFKDAGSRAMARRVSEALLRLPALQELLAAKRSNS